MLSICIHRPGGKAAYLRCYKCTDIFLKKGSTKCVSWQQPCFKTKVLGLPITIAC